MTGPVTFYKYLGVLPFDAKNHPQRHRVNSKTAISSPGQHSPLTIPNQFIPLHIQISQVVLLGLERDPAYRNRLAVTSHSFGRHPLRPMHQ